MNILAEPVNVYRKLRERPAWLAAVCSLIVFWLILGGLRIPAMEAAVRNIFVRAYSEESAEIAGRAAMRFIRLQVYVLEPAGVIANWFAASTVLFIAVRMRPRGGAFGFSHACSLAAYSQAPYVWMEILNTVILYYRGFDALRSSADLRPLRGIDYFITSDSLSPIVKDICSEINPFSVWYVILLGTGIFIIAGISARDGGAIAGAVWLSRIALRCFIPLVEQLMAGFLLS
ncbi:MAG TPA: YIP1 family protein [Bacteroidota bacterium]|nr:YIP1 family protein [Bacteroidota bacterium]